jgi:hypothetical protein
VPSFKTLAGLIISDYRGMFFFAPVTMLCLFAFLVLRPHGSWRSAWAHPLLLPSIALLLMISAHSMWWGGWAFGPRHLTALAVLLLAGGIPLLPARKWVRWSFLLLSSWGLVLAFGAKFTTAYGLPTDVDHPFQEMILPALLDKRLSDMQWTTLAGFSPMMGAALFLAAFVASLTLFRILEDRATTR